jgi:predicted XRE-type DNA-binding protein
MTKEKIEITKGSVYSSLHSAKTAEEMAVKASLVREILKIKQCRKLTQTKLGEIIGMNQADVSRMLKGNFRNIAVNKIMQCLTSLSRDVRITIEPHPVENEVGTIEVLAVS